MSERAKFRGQLAETEEKEGLLTTRLKGLVESLRDQLDPIADVGELDGNVIASQATDFAAIQIELVQVRSKINQINKLLG
jgi:hypothetical protein